MIRLLQNDNRWKDQKLGACSDTIGTSGCFITSLAMMSDKLPNEVNDILKNKGGYSNGCLVNPAKAAELLGLEYYGISQTKPPYDCICETTYYAPKVPQHFFVLLKDGTILNPLNVDVKYPIKSYRLFKAKEQTMKTDLKKSIAIRRDGRPGVYAITPIPSPNALQDDYGIKMSDVLVYKSEPYFANTDHKEVISGIRMVNPAMFEMLDGNWPGIQPAISEQYISKEAHNAILKKSVLDAVSIATKDLMSMEDCQNECKKTVGIQTWGELFGAIWDKIKGKSIK